MLTLCWGAKGGSGTTVVTASMAIAQTTPTLLVDLAGDLPAVLGLPDPDGPGAGDWLTSSAAADRLDDLTVPITESARLLPRGRLDGPGRWPELADHLAAWPGQVVVDAGTGAPIAALLDRADRAWLVTRPCYLAMRHAVRDGVVPTGIVLVEEPGRSLRPDDIEASIGAPIALHLLVDPAVARAVDAGLLLARLPLPHRRRFRSAA